MLNFKTKQLVTLMLWIFKKLYMTFIINEKFDHNKMVDYRKKIKNLAWLIISSNCICLIFGISVFCV